MADAAPEKTEKFSSLKQQPGPGYTWNQTGSEIMVTIPIPQTVLKGKDLEVKILPNSIDAKIKGSSESLLKGETYSRLDPTETTWSIDDTKAGKFLVIDIQKPTRGWWKCVIKGHPEIDVSKIENPMGDVDPAMAAKMHYDQKQRELGLPTSDEQQAQELVKRFMEEQAADIKNKIKFPLSRNVMIACVVVAFLAVVISQFYPFLKGLVGM